MTRWPEPDVAYNFLYRPPANSLQSVFKYFVAAEIGIANTLHRHFWWGPAEQQPAHHLQ